MDRGTSRRSKNLIPETPAMRYTGVDGCRGGWCVVTLPGKGPGSLRIEPDFQSVWQNHRDSSMILVDMPIGLLEDGKNGNPARACDTLARKLLGKGATSRVFPVPCRQAVYAEDKAEARRLNLQHLGRSIPAQALKIVPRIREVDECLLHTDEARKKVFECHPEIIFKHLNDGNTLPGKRTPEGIRLRNDILQRYEPRSEDILNQGAGLSKRYAALDDVLDALACAMAGLKAKGRFQSLPEDVPLDPKGLPMQMVYWKP
ncbi:MAG: DUF429 domain-containing protein [Candidatus Hydrogenedentota bacterium]